MEVDLHFLWLHRRNACRLIRIGSIFVNTQFLHHLTKQLLWMLNFLIILRKHKKESFIFWKLKQKLLWKGMVMYLLSKLSREDRKSHRWKCQSEKDNLFKYILEPIYLNFKFQQISMDQLVWLLMNWLHIIFLLWVVDKCQASFVWRKWWIKKQASK